METDATPRYPWERLSDPDYMSPKVLIWATLLRRAWDTLEEADRLLRDVPGIREAEDRLGEAMQLVGIVEQDLQPLSVYLQGSDG